MKITDLEDADQIVTKQYLDLKLAELRGDFYKAFGDFKADLTKTFWLTQLSTIGIILRWPSISSESFSPVVPNQ